MYGKAVINSIKIQRWWRFKRTRKKNLCKLLISRELSGKKHVQQYIEVYWPSFKSFL